MALNHPLYTIFIVIITALTLSGCTNNPDQPFRLQSLAKSELDMVIDAHLKQTNQHALTLMKKLYKRNPKELKKAPNGTTIETRIQQLFGHPRQVQFNELGDSYANSALLKAFKPNFKGDRVFAYMAGVAGIIHTSYNFQNEFFMLDSINEQKIYNSARNLETASWLLNSSQHDDRSPYLLSNYLTEENTTNLSFERLFGKMIAGQDILSSIVANRNNRTINKVLHGFASTTLLPI